MDLRHLRAFIVVSEELNFRRAAERLHLTQPALSAQIKALEARLEVKLFERTTRSVKATPAGRVLLDEARAVLTAVEQAHQRAKQADQGLVGTLRLGVIAPNANAWLAGILRRFRERFPGVQLSLFDLTTPEQIERLRAGELDAGLLRPPVSFPELTGKLVAESAQALALPAGHRLAKKRALTWADFHREPLVLGHPRMQHGFYDAFLAACEQAGAKPVVAQYTNDIQTKLWLISAGFGIAPTVATMAEMQRPGLVFRALPPGLPPVQTVLAWRRSDGSPILKHFCDGFVGVKRFSGGRR